VGECNYVGLGNYPKRAKKSARTSKIRKKSTIIGGNKVLAYTIIKDDISNTRI
jgi:hypothetical protein